MQIVAGSLMALLLVVAYLHGMKPAARPRYSIALFLEKRVPMAPEQR